MDCRVTPGNDRAEMGEGVACRLVPQGGFEPSTYRLRSDCSAVELLRRDQGALISAALCLGKARGRGNGSICQRTPGKIACALVSERASVTTDRHARLLRPLPRLQPNSGLPEFGHLLTGRSRINPTSAGGTGRGHAKR